MNDKIKNIVSVIVFALLFVTISAACIFTPDKEYSNSERRELSKFPKASAESVFSGDFSSQFDSYTTDQFPKREAFRTIKAALSQFALKKLDNNGLYSVKGHISKIDAKENEAMLNHAAERFTYIYNTYLNNNKVYLSIVPDKNFVLAKSNGYPSLDYTKFIKKMRSKVDFMEYIDVTHLLSEDDYYTTDTHWRQENIVDISRHLLTSMKTDINGGKYTRVFSSDALEFGGTGAEAPETVISKKTPWNGRDLSISVTIPPMSATLYRVPKKRGKKGTSC